MIAEHQHDLFGGTPPPEPPTRRLARTENPPTSHQAATRVREFASEHHRTILKALQGHGARGLTVHEIAAYCRLDANAIGKRVGEMERDGLIDTGEHQTTRASPSGRQARVWWLTTAGRETDAGEPGK